MKHLLIRRVRRSPDFAFVSCGREIFDMRDDGGRSVGQTRVLLAAADAPDVRGYAGVGYYVVFAGVSINAEAAKDDEATAGVDIFG